MIEKRSESSQPKSLPLGLVEAATLFSYPTMRGVAGTSLPWGVATRMRLQTLYYLSAALTELVRLGQVGTDKTTPPENHRYEYEQREKERPVKWLWVLVPYRLLRLAVFIYLLIKSITGATLPSMSTTYRIKLPTSYYLSAALMELALLGRVGMDRTTPLESHRYEYEQREKERSMKRLWVFVPYLILCLAVLVSLLLGQSQLAFLFTLACLAYMIPAIILLIIKSNVASRGKTVQSKLGVIDPTPTGDAVLDEILRQMQATGKYYEVSTWFSSSLNVLRADGLCEITERRLAEQGWITLTGKEWVLGFIEMETLMLNRPTDQWQTLSDQLRFALLQRDYMSPDTVCLLLHQTLSDEIFRPPYQVRFPGQSATRKSVAGLYQILSSPQELAVARQRLRDLMQGDQAIAATIGLPLYDTLLSICKGQKSVQD